MKKRQFLLYITERYSVVEEHPWIKYPDHTVFRHRDNRKWFALIMDIPKSKLGLAGNERIDILNVKCDPALIGSLREEEGYYPAYHMNKENWITMILDGSVEDDKIKWLLDLSYELTDTKKAEVKAEYGGRICTRECSINKKNQLSPR